MKVQQITQSDIARSENQIEHMWNYRINSWQNGDTATIWETLDMQPEELSEGNLINIKKESGYDPPKMMFQKK